MKKLKLYLLLTCLVSLSASSQYIIEDFSPVITSYPDIYHSALQADGKMIVSSNIVEVNGSVSPSIFRLSTDGTLDNTFNPPIDLIGDTFINGITVYGDTAIILSGEGKAWILDIEGSLLNALHESIETPVSVNKLSDGFLLTNYSGGASLRKFKLDGTVDSSFGIVSLSSRVNDAIELSDGKIVIVGEFDKVDGKTVGYIACLNPDGSLDETFDSGTGADSYIFEIDMDASGNLYLGGGFNEFASVLTPGIVKINDNGGVDNSFSLSDLSANFNGFMDLEIVGNDDHLLISGFQGSEFKMIKTNMNGTKDTEYPTTSAHMLDQFYWGLKLHETDTAIILTGGFNNFRSEDIHGLVALNFEGEVLDVYAPNLGSVPMISEGERLVSGQLLISGKFSKVNGISSPSIALLNEDGTLADFDLKLNSTDHIQEMLVLSNGQILLTGSLNSISRSMVLVNPDGSIDSDFQLAINHVFAMAEMPEERIIIAGGMDYGAFKDLIMIDFNGNYQAGFNAANLFGDSGNQDIYAIDLLHDGRIAVGGYNYDQGNGFFHILTEDASSIEYSRTELTSSISTIKTIGEDKIIYGGYNGNSPNYIFQRDYDGNISGADYQITSQDTHLAAVMPLPNNDVIFGGRFTSISNQEYHGLARAYLDGSMDEHFQLDIDGEVMDVIPVDQSHAYVIGRFDRINQTNNLSIAKVSLYNDPPVLTSLKDMIVINEDEPYTLSAADFIYLANGNSEGQITLKIEEGDHFTLDGTTITPLENFNGILELTVLFAVESGFSNPLSIGIEVLPVNDTPTITGQSSTMSIAEDSLFVFSVDLLTIEDPDDDSFTVTLSEGANYTVDDLTVFPTHNYNGKLSISVTISDGELPSNVFDYMLEVLAVNDPPVIISQTSAPAIATHESIEITLDLFEVEDPDTPMENLSIAIGDGDNYSVDGTMVTPNDSFVGTLSVNTIISDGELSSEIYQTQIIVEQPLGASSTLGWVYPNPVSDRLIINAAEFVNGNFYLMDTKGRLILSGDITSSSAEITTFRELPQGVYFIYLSRNEHTVITRVIKN